MIDNPATHKTLPKLQSCLNFYWQSLSTNRVSFNGDSSSQRERRTKAVANQAKAVRA